MPNGKCPKCGVNAKPTGKSYCEPCEREYQKDYHANKRAEMTPKERKYRRDRAREKWQSLPEEERDRRRKLHNSWLKSLSGKRLEAHKKRVNHYMKKRAVTRKTYLIAQRKANYQRRLERSKAGKCRISLSCPEPTIGKTGFCLKHWLVYIAAVASRRKYKGRRLAKVSSGELLGILNQQKMNCAISGHPLVPGDGASLDHIHPVNRGGTNSISNLRFIYQTINRIKADMLDHEFKAFLLKYWKPVIKWAETP